MILPRWVFRTIWALDNAASRLSGGRLTMPNGSRGRLRTLFLHTVGRTSGQPRRNGLYYVEDGPNLVVVASNAGDARDPAWWRNLQAQPEAEVEVGPTVRPVRARPATAEEAGRLYERFATAIPTYDEYRQKAGRTIPVVILEPR
ncbi:MAG: nitroreductase/quinone reductase family protein [Candidatus Limnocylindrales bacterium]